MNLEVSARLLVVDDELHHLGALCEILRDQGYDATGAPSGEAALAELDGPPFDLLLTDLRLPGIDGITLLRSALARQPDLAVVVMTGQGTVDSAVEAMRSGALDYVQKPLKRAVLLPVLARALEMRRLRLANAALERQVLAHAEELEASNRELEAFTRSASHDLRSPLMAVMGLAQLLRLRAGPRLEAEHQGWLAEIERATRRMQQLIDSLLRLSRYGRQALKLQPVDLGALAEAVVEELEQALPDPPVAVRIDPLPPAVADPALLRQVWANLIGNAFKFSRKMARPLVHVGCDAGAETPIYFVRDNGCGFAAEEAQRLFEPFHRLHRQDEYEGSGVGLSIVHRIVQRHGGRVWAESAPGAGATFRFTIGTAAGEGERPE